MDTAMKAAILLDDLEQEFLQALQQQEAGPPLQVVKQCLQEERDPVRRVFLGSLARKLMAMQGQEGEPE